ncbi:hypothetical protein MRX96_004631 [Rhipicephalus microplus]
MAFSLHKGGSAYTVNVCAAAGAGTWLDGVPATSLGSAGTRTLASVVAGVADSAIDVGRLSFVAHDILSYVLGAVSKAMSCENSMATSESVDAVSLKTSGIALVLLGLRDCDEPRLGAKV